MLPAALLACAVGVTASTLEAVISVESGGNVSAVHRNTNGTVDLGLMQINSANLSHFGVSPAQVMDPCLNVHIGSTILQEDYADASAKYGEGQRALQAALSAYNTGSLYRGMNNGYVAKYYTHLPKLPDIHTPAEKRALPLSPFQADTEIFWKAGYGEIN